MTAWCNTATPRKGGAFVEAVRGIYAMHPAGGTLQHAPIEPFIGRAFREPNETDLRILALGVNSYVDDDEWSKGVPPPGRFSSWFEKSQWTFFPRVASDADVLADRLRREARCLAERKWRNKDGVCLTNFVKSYVRTSAGKREGQLGNGVLEAYKSQWEAEIDAMAASRCAASRRHVLPHVVVVYSRRIWDRAWRAFYEPSSSRPLKVHEYRALTEEPQHRVNRLVVSSASGRTQPLLLLRLRHPSSPDKTASPEWLLSQSAVQSLLELASQT
jgi:hypothetical protein